MLFTFTQDPVCHARDGQEMIMDQSGHNISLVQLQTKYRNFTYSQSVNYNIRTSQNCSYHLTRTFNYIITQLILSSKMLLHPRTLLRQFLSCLQEITYTRYCLWQVHLSMQITTRTMYNNIYILTKI
jgi:hypothetical protein